MNKRKDKNIVVIVTIKTHVTNNDMVNIKIQHFIEYFLFSGPTSQIKHINVFGTGNTLFIQKEINK